MNLRIVLGKLLITGSSGTLGKIASLSEGRFF